MGDIHISYQKTKAYTPQEFDYDSSKAWYDDIMKRFRALKKRRTGGDLTKKWWGMSSSHQGLLKSALRHRFDNKNDADRGWNIFGDIIGEYEIALDDKTVIQRRMTYLSRILDILNADKKLTTEDPNPPRKQLGESKGDSDVSEPEDIDIEKVVRKGTLISALEMKDKLSMGGVMGYVSRNYPQFAKQMKEVSVLAASQVDEILQIIEKEGIAPIEVMLKEEFSRGRRRKRGEKEKRRVINL